MWCWKRLLRVPWTARRSNQSILKEISPDYSLEGLMLKLKLQCLATWCEEPDPDAGKHWRQEDKGPTEDGIVRWYHWLNGHKFEQAPGIGDVQGSLVCCSSWGRRVRHDWATELNWTELTLERCYWDYLKYTLLAFPPVCLDHSSARLNLHNLFH